jgi:hypothetical protein
VTFHARGHADIRGSHAKTLEFTRAPGITARATCIVGVAADWDEAALAGFDGDVVVEMEAGGVSDRVAAVARPGFAGGDSLIVRRSTHRSPSTFAVDADKGAADLDRRLVAALADDGAIVKVTVTEAAPPDGATLTLAVVPGGRPALLTGELGAALRAADLVVAADADPEPVRALLAGLGLDIRLARAPEDHDGAVVVLGTEGTATAGAIVPGARVVPAAAPSEELGVLAALTAPGPAAGALIGPPSPAPAERVRLLAVAGAAGLAVAWREEPEALAAALADAGAAAGERPVALATGLGTSSAALHQGPAAELSNGLDPAGLRGTHVVAVPAPAARAQASPVELDAFVGALLDQGVLARTIAEALGSLPGQSYRPAYTRVLDLKKARS